MNICLELRGVEVAFGSLKAIDQVSLSVPQGQRRVIIGPNGAGKTSLFNAISGDYPPSAGQIRFYEKDITKLPAYRRAALGIGRTYQINNLLSALSVSENLILAMRGVKKRKFAFFSNSRPTAEEQQAMDTTLEACAISHLAHETVHNLSYGEQRRLEIAMALSASPRLLLLDEPAAGLTTAERLQMARLISELPRSLTLIMIEHNMEQALSLADYVTCLAAGRLLAEDDAQAIGRNPLVQEVYLGGMLHA